MNACSNSAGAAAAGLPSPLIRWRQTVEAELKGVPFEKKLVSRTFEGIPLQPVYTRTDVAGLPAMTASAGVAPFLRGVRANGYREVPWETAQEFAAASPLAFNAALLAGLQGGQNSVVLVPGRLGRPRLLSLSDLRTALAGVDLAAVPVHYRTETDPLPLAANHLALAQERNFPWERLTGSVATDPLARWAESGRLPGGLEAAHAASAGWTRWAVSHGLQLRTLETDAALWANAGATAVQELALAIAALAEHVRAFARHDLDAATVAGRSIVRLSAGPQFFMELAKFRALRPLITRVLVAFGASADDAAHLAVHAATTTWNKTLLDPYVNMLRATTEALSAVLGNCDALHIAPFDEVSGATTEFSQRIARNVHTILAEEFGFSQVADPAGGSWYVERLTDEIARAAWAFFQQIESRGGLAAALRTNFVQDAIARAREDKCEAVARRRAGLIGTNLFPNLKEKPLSPPAARPAEGPPPQAPRVPPLPATASWPARLEAALAAVREGALLDELASALPPGSDEPPITQVDPWRASAGFEHLRSLAAALTTRLGHPPRVFLAKIGPVLQHKARADFANGFFAVGGFEVIGKQAFATASAAATAAREAAADIAVLCSTDETYPSLVPEFAAAAQAGGGKPILILAGLPADPAQVVAYREAGIDEFIHLRADVHATLAKLLETIGGLP